MRGASGDEGRAAVILNRMLMLLVSWLLCCTIFATAAALSSEAADSSASFMSSSRQIAVVRTANWQASHGTLQRFERASVSAPWQAVGSSIPVVVGRNGLAWGIGLHAIDQSMLPVKIEGDGKAPAGLFSLGPAFGYAAPASVSWIRLPYIQSDPALRCVDDAASRHYNSLVSEGVVARDWKSSEDMLRKDEVYRLGMVIQHNWAEKTIPGNGSCIFFHIWEGPDIGTSGCTAMHPVDLEQLLRWLDPAANPLLLQLPESEMRRFREIPDVP